MTKNCSYAFSGCQMPAVGAWWYRPDGADLGEVITWLERPLYRCWEHRHLPPAQWQGRGYEWLQEFQPGQQLAALEV